ncbi:hypothetical protein V6Z11_D04G207200 [Gossypium hirsutum]
MIGPSCSKLVHFIEAQAMEFQEQLHFALAFTKTIAILVVTILVKGKKRQKRKPPEPDGALPFIGHLHLFGKNQLLHRIFADMANKHGPAFLIRLEIHRALVVNNWKVAKECFTTNDKVFPTRPKSISIKYMGRRLELLKHVRDNEIGSFIKELYKQSVKNGGVALLEMKERIGDLATNIIVRMVAGKIYHGTSEESRRFQKALSDFFYLAGLFLVSDTIPFLGWLDVVMGNIGKIKRTTKELDFAIGSWVNEHRERRLDKGIEGNQDFIDVMLSIMDENNVPVTPLTRIQLRNRV